MPVLEIPVIENADWKMSVLAAKKMPILENAGTEKCQHWEMRYGRLLDNGGIEKCSTVGYWIMVGLKNDSTGKSRFWKMLVLSAALLKITTTMLNFFFFKKIRIFG